MIDPLKIVQTWLLGTSSVTALLGTSPGGGVYGGGDLPEHFNPSLGPCVQIYVAGGTNHEEIKIEVMPRIAVKCWANVNEYQLARALYRAVYDTMHGANMVDFGDDGRVLGCQSVSQGQEITDPDVSWVSVLGYFELDAIQTAPATLQDFVNSTQTVQQYIDDKIAQIAGMDDNL